MACSNGLLSSSKFVVTTKKQELRDATQQHYYSCFEVYDCGKWPNSKYLLPDYFKVYWSIQDDIVVWYIS